MIQSVVSILLSLAVLIVCQDSDESIEEYFANNQTITYYTVGKFKLANIQDVIYDDDENSFYVLDDMKVTQIWIMEERYIWDTQMEP